MSCRRREPYLHSASSHLRQDLQDLPVGHGEQLAELLHELANPHLQLDDIDTARETES